MIFSTAPAYRNCHQRLLQWANRAARFANEANCFNPITLVIARARSSSAMSNFYAAAGNTRISINVSRRHWGQSQCIYGLLHKRHSQRRENELSLACVILKSGVNAAGKFMEIRVRVRLYAARVFSAKLITRLQLRWHQAPREIIL